MRSVRCRGSIWPCMTLLHPEAFSAEGNTGLRLLPPYRGSDFTGVYFEKGTAPYPLRKRQNLSAMESMTLFFDERSHYERKAQQNPETRFWGSVHAATCRYAALAKQIDLQEKSLVDIGCGSAGFLEYLISININTTSYVGIDIVPAFVDEAKNKFPHHDFFVFDASSDTEWPVDKADWVIASGLFGHAQKDDQVWFERLRHVLDRMWAHANNGIAFNLISTSSPKRNPDAHYAKPEEIFTFLQKRFSKKIILDHSYLENDFLCVVHK